MQQAGEKLAAEKASMQQEGDKLLAEKNQLVIDLQQKAQEARAGQEELTALRSKLELQMQINTSKETQHAAEIARLNRELGELKADTDNEVAKQQGWNNELEENVAAFKQQLDGANEQIAEKNKEIAALKTASAKSAGDENAKQTKLAEAIADKTELVAKVNRLQTALKDAQTEAETSAKNLADAKMSNAAKVKDLQREIERLKGQMRTISQEKQDMTEDRDKIKMANDELVAQATQAASQIHILQTQSVLTAAQIETLRKTEAELNKIKDHQNQMELKRADPSKKDGKEDSSNMIAVVMAAAAGLGGIMLKF